MGYTSQLHGELTITRSVPAAEKTYPAELIKLAAENNVPLPELPTQEGFSEETLKELRENLNVNYWLFIEDNLVKVVGESGKMYQPFDVFQPLINAANKDRLLLNGEFIRSGEKQGDVERFIFKNNTIIVDTAQLVWKSDGSPVQGSFY